MANSSRRSFRDWIRSPMSADLRSLALFRISLGSIVLIDTVDRLVDAQMHYTDFGVLPRDLMVTMADFHRFAVFQLMSGSLGFQYFLFAIQILFAIAFIIGFRTRLSTLVLWALTLSLQSRDIQIGYSVDLVLRFGLLWGAFLPLGERFSVDRALAPEASRGSDRYEAPAVLGLFLLIASIYGFTAALKEQSPAWRSGMGTYYALSLDEYVMPLGRWLLGKSELLKLANNGTLIVEAFGWIPLFFPWKREWLRLPLFLFFACFHLGMGLCLNVTLFQCAAVALWTCVLPEAFWSYAGRFVAKWGGVAETIRRHWHLRGERVGPRQSTRWTVWINALAFLIMGISFYWNLVQIDSEQFPLFKPLETVGMTFGLDQRWDMFATAASDSGWFVIPAVLADGSVVDLFNGGQPVSFNKPDDIYTQFRDERERKMMLRLAGFNVDPFRMAYGRYLCRAWNAEHDDPGKRLEAFKILFMQQMILPNGGKGTPKVLMLWRHECGPGLLDKWKSKLEPM